VRVPTHRVRELPRHQGETEKAAWYGWRGRELGAQFRRPRRLENWGFDFYGFEAGLAIEPGGGVH